MKLRFCNAPTPTPTDMGERQWNMHKLGHANAKGANNNKSMKAKTQAHAEGEYIMEIYNGSLRSEKPKVWEP